MAVPPTIPTSFVPKQPVEMHPRQMESGNNMFLIVSLVIMGITVVLAILVFAYAHLLSTQSADKAAQLKTAEASVSEDTVNNFIRLRDRLSQAQTILDQHVILSQFFDSHESLTLTNVRFTSLSLAIADDHTANVKMTGTAKTFNALAAQSAAFATQPLIKQAIFSGITADTNGVVTFNVSATLDPRLVDIGSSVPASWTSGGALPVESSSTATTTP